MSIPSGPVSSWTPAEISGITYNDALMGNLSVSDVDQMTSAQLQALSANAALALETWALQHAQNAVYEAALTRQAIGGTNPPTPAPTSTSPLTVQALTAATTITVLPPTLKSALTTLNQDVLASSALAPYFASSNPLPYYNMPLNGLFATDVQSFLTDYDAWYRSSQYQPIPALDNLYNILANREYISTSGVALSALTSKVTAMFTWLTGANNVLDPQTPPATGSDVTGYCETVDQVVGQTLGQLSTFIADAQSVANQESSLSGTVIDAITGATLSPDVVLWLANGASSNPQTSGNISYDGTDNLTYQSALTTAETDLLRNGDTFFKNAQSGIAQVLDNQSVAATKSLISEIFDIVGGITSSIAGIGKTLTAFQAAAASASTANIVKASAELASDSSLASSITKNEVSDWLTPQKSAVSGQLEYTGINAMLTDTSSLLNTLVPATSINGLAPLEASFLSDLTALTNTIEDNTKQGTDILGALSPTIGLPNTMETITFDDFFGNSSSVSINPAALFAKGLSSGSTTYVAGPAVNGYLSTQWENVSTFHVYGDRQPGGYYTDTVQLVGHNVV